jgi:hypothetical protein
VPICALGALPQRFSFQSPCLVLHPLLQRADKGAAVGIRSHGRQKLDHRRAGMQHFFLFGPETAQIGGDGDDGAIQRLRQTVHAFSKAPLAAHRRQTAFGKDQGRALIARQLRGAVIKRAIGAAARIIVHHHGARALQIQPDQRKAQHVIADHIGEGGVAGEMAQPVAIRLMLGGEDDGLVGPSICSSPRYSSFTPHRCSQLRNSFEKAPIAQTAACRPGQSSSGAQARASDPASVQNPV